MEIVNVLYNGTGQSVQNYSDRDLSLINSTFINTTFGDPNDYIEAFISDEVGTILNYDYNLQSYYKTSEVNSGTNKFTSILVDPQKDIADKGFNRGSVTIQYNVLKNLFNSKYGVFYWIKDISPSRLELKLSSQQLSGDTMRSGFAAYQNYISQKNYYSDFYLNFGDNNLILAVNAAYVSDDQGSYILIKLYEPLPSDFDLKSRLWIVDKLSESVSFNVNVSIEAEQIDTTQRLRGPNFKIEVAQKIGQSTPFYSYNNLFSSQVSSSIRQLMSYYDDKAVAINTDYSDFKNFIHFSSATERISNFAYKVGLIETYNNQIVSQSLISGNSTVQSITTASINTLKSNIDAIIEKFDNYEYYLYFTSGTFAWPKSNSTKPYNLYSVTSSQAINWLGTTTTVPTTNKLSILYSASFYDETNKDLLSATIPQYLLDDPNNQPYVTFLDMIGQHFDNIWIYYKDVSNRFNATNDPNTGISLDLVSDALKGLGIELYSNTNLSDTAYYSLFGINNTGTSSFPTGSEKNIKVVSSSLASLPFDQIQKEIYKRVYHNLPYLLKTRGTERGVKALIACYGIPDSILTVNEFGGTALGGEDIFELNDTKINLITPTELSQSVLSPKSTIQQYDSNYRKNSLSVEIGFSPSDTLNADITSSLSYSIDQLIGNPALRYSSSYTTLDTYKNNYFSSSYNKPHSIAEYVRLIKFYNNSLFKMIKDFVPARANVSTGIIVKPHVLERNKYARNEPQTTIHNNYTESIQMLTISGSAATSYNCDTTNYRIITSSLGYIPSVETYGFEKYTGQYQGSKIIATNLNSMQDQREFSKMKNIPIGILYGLNNNQYSPYVTSSNNIVIDYESVNAGFPILFPGQGAAGAIAIYAPVYPTALQNLLDDPTTVAIKIFDESKSANDGMTFELKSTKYYGGGVSSFVIYVEPNALTSAAALVTTKFTVVALKKVNPPYKVELGAIYQNVTESVRSQRRLDLDYTYNSRTPVNFNAVTKSIKDSIINNFATYTNRNNPYAELQDYNYNTQRSTIPRYYGSKTISKTYNTYTSASNAWQGDSSYGNTAAIDRNSYKVGWVKNIPAKALNFPDKTTIYLKYLIDSSQNITDLSRQNNNLFEVQNTFKTGDPVVLSISDVNRPSNQKTLDGSKFIFKGGFSYDPIFYREGYGDDLRFVFTDSNYFTKIENAEGFYVQSNKFQYANTDLQGQNVYGAYSLWINSGQGYSSPTDPNSMTYQKGQYIDRLTLEALQQGGIALIGNLTSSTTPISNAIYSSQAWNNLYPNDNDINFYAPNTLPYSYLNTSMPYGNTYSILNGWQAVFRFPLEFNDFTNGLSSLNEELGANVNGNGQYTYIAQYNGTYLINSIVDIGVQFYNAAYTANIPNSTAVQTARIYKQTTYGDFLKVVCILEKSSDGGSTWTKVASSKIQSVDPLLNSFGGSFDTNTNIVYIPVRPNSNDYNGVKVTCILKSGNSSIVSLPMLRGDILRYNMYIVDMSAAFKTSGRWEIYRGPILNLGNSIPASDIESYGGYPKLQIRNTSVPFYTYISEVTVPKSVIALLSVNDNVATLINTTLCQAYNSSSIFIPQSESVVSQNYSEVVDNFNVQQGDLVRFGSFTYPQITEYYTVLSVSSSVDYTTDLGNQLITEYDFFNKSFTGFIANDTSYAAVTGISGDRSSCIYLANPTSGEIDYFNRLINNGSPGFVLSGITRDGLYGDTNTVPIETNNKVYTFRTPANGASPIKVYTNYNFTPTWTNSGGPQFSPPWSKFAYIYVNETVQTGTATTYPMYTKFTEQIKKLFTVPNIIVDRPISTASLNPNTNFAILRPKPDETSVIIDFTKKEGEVSQTILIPQDASEIAKSKVGDIFRNFNTDLQDSTLTNTP